MVVEFHGKKGDRYFSFYCNANVSVVVHTTLSSSAICSTPVVQSPLVIVDSSVCRDLSTITSNSTITGEIHAKIDNRSAQSVQVVIECPITAKDRNEIYF